MGRVLVDPQKRYRHLKNKVPWATCDKCGWNWPERILHERRDGRKICPNHTTQRESSAERTARIEKLGARLARLKEPVPKWPHTSEMRAVAGVTSLTPKVVSLTRGGANKTLVLAGRNLSAAVTFAFSSPSVEIASATTFTTIDPETFGNTATLTVRAPIGGVNGDYDLLVNGDVFKKVFEVRG